MSRPEFLLGTVPLYVFGTVAGWGHGRELDLTVAALGLLLVWSIQVATHYNNEFRDVPPDRLVDRATRVSGGSRVLVEGWVSPHVARIASFVSLGAVGVTLAALVTWMGAGRWLLGLAGAALVAGWYYSAPPVALSRRGVGELTAAVVAGFLVPTTAYYLQQPTVPPGFLGVCLPVVALLFALSVATAIPDVDADRSAGKLTLAARLGRRRAASLQGALWVLGWLGSVYAVSSLDATIGTATLIAGVPLAVVEWRYLPRAGRGVVLAAERVAFGTAATVALVTAALVLAYWP